jgi:acetyl esterase/lipase
MASIAAMTVGAPVVSVDYRMPPDHPYPAAIDDGVAVYRALLADHAPGDIVVGGLSAGGNIAAATVLRARDEGLPLPAGLVLLSPEIDLTESGDSFETLLGIDRIVRFTEPNALYAAGAALDDPYVSPLFGDFTKGFPPTFLQSGTRDLFLSNTVLMHRALRRAGVAAELHVFEAMPHGGFQGAPEDVEVAAEQRGFAERCWAAAGNPLKP